MSDPSSAGVLLTRLGGIIQRNRSGAPEIRPPSPPLSTPLAGRHKGSPPYKKISKNNTIFRQFCRLSICTSEAETRALSNNIRRKWGKIRLFGLLSVLVKFLHLVDKIGNPSNKKPRELNVP